jgi:hypothetical protein
MLTDRGLHNLAGLRYLVSLSLCDNPHFHFEDASFFCKLSTLERLDLSGCSFLGDSTLRIIVSLPKLLHLAVANCRQITPNGLQMLSQLSQLLHLDLGGCRLTDNEVANLVCLSRLTYLSLASTNTTDAGLQLITYAMFYVAFFLFFSLLPTV